MWFNDSFPWFVFFCRFPEPLEGVPGVRAFVGPDATRARLHKKKKKNFNEKSKIISKIFENLAPEKNVEFVDLVKPFPTVLRLLNLVSIQPRTDRSKFGNEERE